MEPRSGSPILKPLMYTRMRDHAGILLMTYYCENCGHKVGSTNSANVHRRFGHTVVTLMLEAPDLADEFDEDELEQTA